ncbi:hypothetical protein C8Q80DRAFT_405149 [Daedaleopsis nitida]|nr:hypothetical protein C8Q80DRAFT_405149 [Daedaleopsis nitida]
METRALWQFRSRQPSVFVPIFLRLVFLREILPMLLPVPFPILSFFSIYFLALLCAVPLQHLDAQRREQRDSTTLRG